MSFKDKFNSKNPFTGGPNNPPKEEVPHFKVPGVSKLAMNLYYGTENADKMMDSVNTLIDFYNQRPDPNVMTDDEREYRRDVLKAVTSNPLMKPSVAMTNEEQVDQTILPNLDKNLEEQNTTLEYTSVVEPGEAEKQRASIALNLYDEVPEEQRLYTQTEYGWKPKALPNLTSKEKAGVINYIKEKGKDGKIDLDGFRRAIYSVDRYGQKFNEYLHELVMNGLLNEGSNRKPEVYIDENNELIFEQRASTPDDLPLLAKPLVNVDNLKEIQESGIVNLPNIKFKM